MDRAEEHDRSFAVRQRCQPFRLASSEHFPDQLPDPILARQNEFLQFLDTDEGLRHFAVELPVGDASICVLVCSSPCHGGLTSVSTVDVAEDSLLIEERTFLIGLLALASRAESLQLSEIVLQKVHVQRLLTRVHVLHDL